MATRDGASGTRVTYDELHEQPLERELQEADQVEIKRGVWKRFGRLTAAEVREILDSQRKLLGLR